jgi:protein translocase SecG subunit
VLLVINCLFLILLVLIQLPKKEAGVGVAFGGGATDALFGAGSGNALTKLTKYASATFLLMSLFLGVLNSKAYRAGESDVRKALATQRPATAPAPAPAKPSAPSTFTPLSTNGNLSVTLPTATNAATPAVTRPAATTTNAPAPTTK